MSFTRELSLVDVMLIESYMSSSNHNRREDTSSNHLNSRINCNQKTFISSPEILISTKKHIFNIGKNNDNNNIIIILLKQDYKIQLANNKIQMAWLTSWLVVG